MAGNVWEWVNDWHDYSYYSTHPVDGWPDNPTGPETGTYRVLRGGGWNSSAYYLRVADRETTYPTDQFSIIGFRCAAPAPEE